LTKEVRSLSPPKSRLTKREEKSSSADEEAAKENKEDEEQTENPEQEDPDTGASFKNLGVLQPDAMAQDVVNALDEKLGFIPSSASPSRPSSVPQRSKSPSSSLLRGDSKSSEKRSAQFRGSRKMSPSKSQKFNPVDSAMTIEETIDSMQKPFPSKLSKKPPKVDPEAMKYLKFAMTNNQNVSLF
jgi:hypothetical protein